jgi:hypothetical protein
MAALLKVVGFFALWLVAICGVPVVLLVALTRH